MEDRGKKGKKNWEIKEDSKVGPRKKSGPKRQRRKRRNWHRGKGKGRKKEKNPIGQWKV